MWRAVAGFPDLRAAEDLIFIERCQRVGKIAWAPLAIVQWQLQPSLMPTFRRFALYSYHNVLAGRQRYWHYGIARKYLMAVLVVILAAAHSRVWLFALAFAAVARVAKSGLIAPRIALALGRRSSGRNRLRLAACELAMW